jgi:large subunit ribosomal protein L31
MKESIHPAYYPDAQVICACGNTWTTGSTKVIHTDVCSNCHPFFTGEQRIVDTEGQVDRFYKKLQVRQQYIDDKTARINELLWAPRSRTWFGARATITLAKANITNVGQIMDLLEKGETAILAVDGFGRKSLADLKKRLRQFGYELPEAAQEIVV